MKFTNRLNLPQPIVDAVTNDSYSKGDADISVTELLLPPQLRRLYHKHYDEIEEDVADRMPALFGQSVHAMIERAGLQPYVLSETTVYTVVDDKKIKGTVDHVTLSNMELCDFKVTNARKVKANVPPPEWVQQTNIYRWMLYREHGVVIKSMAIIAILRDWTKYEAATNPDYPQSQAVRLEVPLWDDSQVEAFVRDRLAVHYADETVLCSDADIWAKPTKWAVMKRGRQSAVKLYDTYTEASERAYELGSAHYVERRPGKAMRCEYYCPVSMWCAQWQADDRRGDTEPSVVSSLFS